MRSGPIAVVYDIGSNRRRAAVAGALADVGARRVQQSTWVLPPRDGGVVAFLARMIEGTDRVWAYQSCAECRRRTRWLPGEPPLLQALTRPVVVSVDAGLSQSATFQRPYDGRSRPAPSNP